MQDGDTIGHPYVGFTGTAGWARGYVSGEWVDVNQKASWKVQYRLAEKGAGTGP